MYPPSYYYYYYFFWSSLSTYYQIYPDGLAFLSHHSSNILFCSRSTSYLFTTSSWKRSNECYNNTYYYYKYISLCIGKRSRTVVASFFLYHGKKCLQKNGTMFRYLYFSVSPSSSSSSSSCLHIQNIYSTVFVLSSLLFSSINCVKIDVSLLGWETRLFFFCCCCSLLLLGWGGVGNLIPRQHD